MNESHSFNQLLLKVWAQSISYFRSWAKNQRTIKRSTRINFSVSASFCNSILLQEFRGGLEDPNKELFRQTFGLLSTLLEKLEQRPKSYNTNQTYREQSDRDGVHSAHRVLLERRLL